MLSEKLRTTVAIAHFTYLCKNSYFVTECGLLILSYVTLITAHANELYSVHTLKLQLLQLIQFLETDFIIIEQ